MPDALCKGRFSQSAFVRAHLSFRGLRCWTSSSGEVSIPKQGAKDPLVGISQGSEVIAKHHISESVLFIPTILKMFIMSDVADLRPALPQAVAIQQSRPLNSSRTASMGYESYVLTRNRPAVAVECCSGEMDKDSVCSEVGRRAINGH